MTALENSVKSFSAFQTRGICTGVNSSLLMSAPFGIGSCGTANVSRKRAGAYCDDLFAVHGGHRAFFLP